MNRLWCIYTIRPYLACTHFVEFGYNQCLLQANQIFLMYAQIPVIFTRGRKGVIYWLCVISSIYMHIDQSFLVSIETVSLCCMELLSFMSIVVYCLTIPICDCINCISSIPPIHGGVVIGRLIICPTHDSKNNWLLWGSSYEDLHTKNSFLSHDQIFTVC